MDLEVRNPARDVAGSEGRVLSGDEIRVVSGELRSPIALIRQLAFFLDPENPEQTREFKEKIITVAGGGMRAIRDLELLGAVERRELELEPVAVRGVVEEARQEAEAKIRYYGGRVRARERGERLVIGNRELMKSVIYNMLASSANYLSEEGEVEMTVRERGGFVRIEVRDFGPMVTARGGGRIKKIPFRPDASGVGMYCKDKFTEYMGGRSGVVRHADGVSFYFELRKSGQGVLFA